MSSALADIAAGDAPPVLDVVPLFETTEALDAAGPILEALLRDPSYRAHLAERGDRQEVDARLLRFEQGIGVPGGGLDAPSGPGIARRGRPRAKVSS